MLFLSPPPGGSRGGSGLSSYFGNRRFWVDSDPDPRAKLLLILIFAPSTAGMRVTHITTFSNDVNVVGSLTADAPATFGNTMGVTSVAVVKDKVGIFSANLYVSGSGAGLLATI